MTDKSPERGASSEESWKLRQGAEYESFEEFEKDLKKFSDHNSTLFVIDKSIRIGLRHNTRKSNGNQIDPEKVVYKYVRYRCKQGGRRRFEGRGIRPHQRSFKLSCGAFLVLVSDRKRGKLYVSHFSAEHNHEVSEEIYRNFPEIRRFNNPQKIKGEIFYGLKIDQTKNRSYLNEFSGKRLTLKDFLNMSQKVTPPCLLEEQMLSTIENLFEEDKDAICLFSVKDCKLEHLYVQRSSVKLLEAFSESIFVDVLYKLKGKLMPIISIMIVDDKNEIHIIAQALIENSQTETLSSVLEVFKSENECISSSLSVSNLIQSFEERSKKMDYKTFLDKATISYCATKLVKELRDVSTEYAFEIMLDELKHSEKMSPDMKLKDDGSYELTDNTMFNVTIRPSYASCSCNFNSNTNLPCRHIFFLVSEKGVCGFSKEWIPMKWKKCPEGIVKKRSSKVKGPVKIDAVPPEKVKKMRTKAKYLQMLNMMKLLANMNSTLAPKEYCLRFEILVQLHKLWQDGKRVALQENTGNIKCLEMNKVFQNLANMSSFLGAEEYKDRFDLMLKLQSYWKEGKKVLLVEHSENGENPSENPTDEVVSNSNSCNEQNPAYDSTILSDLGVNKSRCEERELIKVDYIKEAIKDIPIISQQKSISQTVIHSEIVKQPVCKNSTNTKSIYDSPAVMMSSQVDLVTTPIRLSAAREIFVGSAEKNYDDQENFNDPMVIYLEPNSKPDMRPAVQVVVPPSLGTDDDIVKMVVGDPPSLTHKLSSKPHEMKQPCLQFKFSHRPNPNETPENLKHQVPLIRKKRGCPKTEISKRRRINEQLDLTARLAEVDRFISKQSNTEIQDLLTSSLSFDYMKVLDAEELKHRCRYDAVLSLVEEMQHVGQGRILEMVIVTVIQRCKILNVNPKKGTTAYVLGAALLLYSYIHNLKPMQALLTLKPLAIHEISSPQPLVYSEDIHIAVGNTTITQQSLDTLSSGEHLDDQVIYAYLGLQAHLRNVGENKEIFIFPSQLASVWETGQFGNWLFRNVDLSTFRWLFMPIKAEKHWLLLVGNVRNATVIMLDSSFNAERQRKYFYLWINYMVERDKALGPTGINWQTSHMQSTQQEESNNSGMFVLMNADALLFNVPTLIMRNCHANNYKSFVLNQLLKYGHPVGKSV